MSVMIVLSLQTHQKISSLMMSGLSFSKVIT